MDVLVAYGACKKNQNHTSASPVLDGCMEFSSSFKGERKCEACGCHRSFHERIILMRDQNGTISCASQTVLPDMGPLQLSNTRNKDNSSPTSDITNYLTSSSSSQQQQQQQQQQNKRRKLDDLSVAEDVHSDFISGRSNGTIIATNQQQLQQQPVPLQTIELHPIDAEEHKSWLCEADRDKLLSYAGSLKNSNKLGGVSASPAAGSPSTSPPEKLASFFQRLQREHPESPLKLEFVDGSWRVLCGVCARYLRADKKGDSLHNIQKQHFVTPKHISNLQAKLEAPDEMEFWLKRMAKLREKRSQNQQHRYITAS